MAFEAAYLRLLPSGELKRRAAAAYARLEACDLCGRECGANRRESFTDITDLPPGKDGHVQNKNPIPCIRHIFGC